MCPLRKQKAKPKRQARRPLSHPERQIKHLNRRRIKSQRLRRSALDPVRSHKLPNHLNILGTPPKTPEETGTDQGPASPERPQRPRPTAQPPQAPLDSPAPEQGQSSPSQADAQPKTGEPSSDETDKQPQMEPLSKSASYDDEINRLLNELSSEIKK